MEKIARESHPHVELLKQVKGVGTQIAPTYVLTLEDPHRFAKSREVGCFLGLRPGPRNPERASRRCISEKKKRRKEEKKKRRKEEKKKRRKEEKKKRRDGIQTAELDRRDQVTATNSWPNLPW
jgi:transposase